jgi:uroporphyrinogen-III synthase
MAVLVTRPAIAAEATAKALRQHGFEALFAPMLRFEPVPVPDQIGCDAGAVILTSANAVRALADHPSVAQLAALPAFAVGEQTATAARDFGFTAVTAAAGDAVSLRKLILDTVRKHPAMARQRWLYLAGADLTCDLTASLAKDGIEVQTITVYRMAATPSLPDTITDAFAAGNIAAVLHYSRRSAEAFVKAARLEGLEISALALPQCCISAHVASVLREAGAARIAVAQTPDEAALINAMTRLLRRDAP